MSSVKAQDRELSLWYSRIDQGEIKLPRFQRFEAWDRGRIISLLNMIVHNLPLGITLLLEVGDREQFVSRYIKTADKPTPQPRVFEHLLDGQQRLTALWRALHNNYDAETYFLYVPAYDTVWRPNVGLEEEDTMGTGVAIHGQTRWWKTDGTRMPLWADDPAQCFKRGCIPFNLLRPEDLKSIIEQWVNKALEDQKPRPGSPDFEQRYEQYADSKKQLSDLIALYREVVKHYNLPYLALPSTTPKEVALQVFINMNTNSKPLTQYDIIVAEIEGVRDTSLHDMQADFNNRHPQVGKYFDLSFQILYTSALMQGKLPNKKGIWDMDKPEMLANWNSMEQGLIRMAEFLTRHHIFDQQQLPTNAVLAVIAALFTQIPATGDKAGQADILLKKYLWSAFFTDRYENSAASRAYADFIALKSVLEGTSKEAEIDVLNRSRFPLATEEQLLTATWPKYETIRGRGILAVANYFGAKDFADGSELTPSNLPKREYHHIFPDSLLTEVSNYYPDQIKSFTALNCALITNSTNRTIGRKDPLIYLRDRYEWSNDYHVNQRLASHLIPKTALEAATYDGLEGQARADKIKSDYDQFLLTRAQLVSRAVQKLAAGDDIHLPDVMNEHSII